MKELVIFTHNDLDALGGMLNIEYAYPDNPKKYFHTNYTDIPKITNEIIEYITTNNINGVIIEDVSFSDNKESLKKLYNHGKVILLDHHMYPDGFFDEFPNMVVVHDITKSATMLCNEFFKVQGKNRNLDLLTRIIDSYDLWKKDEIEFNFSQDLNEYFWHNIKDKNLQIKDLMKIIADNEYKLPEGFYSVVNSIKQKCKEIIDDYKNRKLIQRFGDTTFCFVDEYFNQIMLDEMKDGQNFVIGMSSYGIVRIRIREECPLSEDNINKLRFLLTNKSNYGHLRAFTYKIKPGLDNIMKEAKKIGDSINEVKKS